MSHDLEAQVAAVGTFLCVTFLYVTFLYVTFLYVVYQGQSYCGA